MKKVFFFGLILMIFYSCKLQPDSNRNYDVYDPNKIYKLQLNPTPGSVYHYDIINEAKTEIETEDKKLKTETKSNSGVNYTISKDSTGDLLFTMNYGNIQLYSKNGDNEINAEAEEGNNALNPIDKILGMLKASTVTATLSRQGDIKNITGYKEIGDKILASFDPNDLSGQAMARSQWQKIIEDGLVKRNLDQLFKIFPDSSIHLRDSWKINSESNNDFGLVTKSSFTLKAINADVAVIKVTGKISSSNASSGALVMGSATADIQGDQDGEFEMETKTGMLLHCEITTRAKGTVTTMGQEIPVTINLSVKVNGRKIK